MAGFLNRLLGHERRDDAPREIQKTDAEWQRELTPEQFHILRQAGTERPFTMDHLEPDVDGMYRCGGCGAVLFDANTKFESGTGWPSFYDAVGDGVELHRDFSMGIPRTEVVCRRCGGHLGHVFNDGPRPTGKRYCINGCALAPPAE